MAAVGQKIAIKSAMALQWLCLGLFVLGITKSTGTIFFVDYFDKKILKSKMAPNMGIENHVAYQMPTQILQFVL